MQIRTINELIISCNALNLCWHITTLSVTLGDTANLEATARN